MHARWTWLAGSVRERETHARSDNSFSENDTSITRRGAAITISPSANPPKGDMDIVKPKGNPPMRADSWNRYTSVAPIPLPLQFLVERRMTCPTRAGVVSIAAGLARATAEVSVWRGESVRHV